MNYLTIYLLRRVYSAEADNLPGLQECTVQANNYIQLFSPVESPYKLKVHSKVLGVFSVKALHSKMHYVSGILLHEGKGWNNPQDNEFILEISV